MSFHGFVPVTTHRRHDSTRMTRRRPPSLKPSLEGLEERLVLSQTATVLPHRAAQVHALATSSSQQISVPITVTAINITQVTRDAATGLLNLNGTLTGTILGQTFTTPVTGTITPGRGARSSVLKLDLQAIDLNLLGLSVKTSTIALNVTARNSGTLGKLLGDGLKGVATTAGSSTAQAASQLNTLLGNTQVLNAIDKILAQAKSRLTSFSPAQGTTSPVINLSLSPTRLNSSGVNARLDNAGRGAVTVNVTANQGAGLLGKIVNGLTGSPTGQALTKQVAGVLQQITATPVPTLPGLGGGTGGTTTGSGGTTGSGDTTTGQSLLKIDLKPLDVNLLGVEVKTSEIIVTVSATPGSGKLLGNLLSTVSSLINLQGVNNALNNVLGNVVTLANAASLSVTGVNTGGVLGSTTTVATTPVLTAHIAPVHLDLLGAVVDTSPIDVAIIAHSGPGQVLGNVVTDLANLLNTPPADGKLDLNYITTQLHTLNDQLNAQIPGIAAAPTPTLTTTPGVTNVLHLTVAPINLNLLGLILQTDTIQVNADAQSGNGNLLGNLLSDLLNTLNATPQNLNALNTEVNNLLAKVVGVLNAAKLTLPTTAVSSLSQTLQTLALPNLINTSGAPATAPVLNLNIASTTSSAPPVDINLLGLVVTTSNIHAQLVAQTGDGQILGNLVYNVSHLLDPGGALGLLTILSALGL